MTKRSAPAKAVRVRVSENPARTAAIGRVRRAAASKPANAAAATNARTSAHATPPSTSPSLPSSARQHGKGCYVYGIIRADAPLSLGPIGIGEEPAPVCTVRYRDLSAVVSDAPPGVLDPTRGHILAHHRVNETVMREHTMLPMSFGTVFRTRDDVMALLEEAGVRSPKRSTRWRTRSSSA